MDNEHESSNNPLGKHTEYPCSYQPSLLFPIARLDKRCELGIEGKPPFFGEDIWNAYEISWLSPLGVPQVAIGEFRFPSSSLNIVESKSLKLYLNSFNQSHFSDMSKVEATIQSDLSDLVGSVMLVVLRKLDQAGDHTISELDAQCIDGANVTIDQYDYDSALLKLTDTQSAVENAKCGAEKNIEQTIVEENLCSHLLKSNCLITNQPDWASVLIQYKGAKISHRSILKYLVSFRTHNEFHEQCVERIFCDLMERCKPQQLTVYARYTRRGGLDINPWRSNHVKSMGNIRLSRQ